MYNEAIAKLGKDPDFYRKDLTGKAKLAQIVKPPFYVIPVKPALLGTYGGLKINTDAQVLNKSGKPISGLWAAGEVTGGVHGARGDGCTLVISLRLRKNRWPLGD